MKNKSNTHYSSPISEQITATAIFREHAYFKNKHAATPFYLGSWPNNFMHFSCGEHEHPLKQKIFWKSDWCGVLGQMEKWGKKEKNPSISRKKK